MSCQKRLYNVTFKTPSGIISRIVDANNMFQGREK